MPNKTGNNQWGPKNYPPDDELRAALIECVKLTYGRKEKLAYLENQFGLRIGQTKLAEIEDRLNIPTVRKPRLPKAAIEQAAADIVRKDTRQANGPAAFKSMLQNELVMIARDGMKQVMKDVAPGGFEKRRPGAPRKELPRVGLIAIGPFHELNADGHEKLNAQALRMGDINLPIYAYRDKWSGYIVKISLLPNSRGAAPLAHLYLDLVEEYGGVPLQLTTDKGSERAWQHAIQDSLRRYVAPDIDTDIYPTAVALKSVHNTVIEALWRWLHQKFGVNLKDLITGGLERHIFNPQIDYHSALFYWIFIPLIQDVLEKFRTYWNHHLVRIQHDKFNPSGHIPADAFRFPKKQDPNADSCLIKVPQELINTLRQTLTSDPEIGPRDAHFQWYDAPFGTVAQRVYDAIGAPPLTLESAWEVFGAMKAPLGEALRLI